MTKNGRREIGYFTVSDEITVDIDVDVNDIIRHLDKFNDNDLSELRDAIDESIGEKENHPCLTASTLEEEYKIKILKELFDKYTWEELEKIKISL